MPDSSFKAQEIISPVLLLDQAKCRKNIEQMRGKAAKNNLLFRPHFKTHQSIGIGNWFRDFDTKSITVSSVQMAKYFADAGWNDITIAFPFNRLEIAAINELAEKIDLNLLLIHAESAVFLAKQLWHESGVFIKIDCGYHRCGISAENFAEIDRLTEVISKAGNLIFKGFLTHSGHTYQAANIRQILAIHEVTAFKMKLLKERYQARFPDLIISVGDTPSSTLAQDFTGIDEIRPGNFVFYDLMQLKLGVCQPEQIALIVACPIVAKNKIRHEITIYGGAIHLSKEFILNDDGSSNYGLIVHLQQNGWSAPIEVMYVSSLSQEHGTIKTSPQYFEELPVGSVIGILPVHSCLTANLMREYHTLKGDRLDHY